jgi:perosamine synthetase
VVRTVAGRCQSELRPGNFIRVYEPWRARNQRAYVNACLDDNLLTFHGRYVEDFERAVAAKAGVAHAVATTSGSTALYAMYHVAGLRGRDVVTSALTYGATAAQLLLAGARVWLVDCDEALQIDTLQLAKAAKTLRPAAVVVPELYADLPDMGDVLGICRSYGCRLLEDSAEAFGCDRGGPAGSFGQMACFSFFANKVTTCGEGGAVVTDDGGLAERLRAFRNQGVTRRFWHGSVGTNFRMSNLHAAVGCAQMEDYDAIVGAKRAVASFYRGYLKPDFGRLVPRAAASTEWMPVFTLPAGRDYAAFEAFMEGRGVETRPVFTPLHLMPAFAECRRLYDLTASEAAAGRHFILPSSPGLTERQLFRVVDAANEYLK